MNYELAKKLADAGFVKKGRPDWFTPMEKIGLCHACNQSDCSMTFYPTLEELIEACGPKFRQFYSYRELAGDRHAWFATSGAYDGSSCRVAGAGQTPIEAVANLWLALNKHKAGCLDCYQCRYIL